MGNFSTTGQTQQSVPISVESTVSVKSLQNDSNNIQNIDTNNTKPKIYKLDELQKHIKQDDLWIALHGKVYNITDFLYEHPGGTIIWDGGGKDASKMFDDVGHSDEAKNMLHKFYIGDLDKSS